jgi:3-keto-5-aminohexanoate cleavage enzyme
LLLKGMCACLEDNIYYGRKKKDLVNNPRLVARIARIGREMGLEPATPAQARKILGLPIFVGSKIEH